MSFSLRRKAFIFVEELNTLEDTKKLLTLKLDFLKQQLKLSWDSINKEGLVTSNFSKSTLFWIDWQIKIANSLTHLVNSSILTWTFLHRFKISDPNHFVLGTLKKDGFILDTEKIYRESENYLFDLLKLGCIGVTTWSYLKKLKNCVDQISTLYLNDSAYYDHRGTEVIEPIEELEEFKRFNEGFTIFLNSPLQLFTPQPVLWNFLKASQKTKNYAKIGETIFNANFNYDYIRSRPEIKAFLSPIQYQELSNSLSQLNSFQKIYQAFFELKIFDDKEASKVVSLFSLLFFLAQESSFTVEEYKISSEKDFLKRIVNSLLWIDLVTFLCENSVNCFSHRKNHRDRLFINFQKACDLQLSTLNDQETMEKVFVFDYSIVSFLLEKIEKLRAMDFYVKHYSQFMDKYLTIIS